MNITTLITIKRMLEEREADLLKMKTNARQEQYKHEDNEESLLAEEYRAHAEVFDKMHTEVFNALQDFMSQEWK